MRTHLRQNQKGSGLVLPIAAVVVVIIAVVALMLLHKSGPSKVLTTTAAKQTNSACLSIYNDKNLCAFASTATNFSKQAYTAVDTATDKSGTTSKFTVSQDGKGNTSVSGSSAGQSYDAITIGNASYIKQGDSWLKYANASNTNNPASDIKPDFSDAKTPAAKRIQYKNLGKEKCGSLTCFKYQITDPSNAGATEYVWFDTSDYLLRQWSSKDSNGTNTFAITYSAVKITAPSPVTDVSSPSSAASDSSAAASSGLTAEEQAQLQQYEQQYGGGQ